MTGLQKGGLVVLGVGALAGVAVLLTRKPKRVRKSKHGFRGFGHGKTGPGKFEGGMEALKQLLYTTALDTSWLDEEESAHGQGWCGMMRGPLPLDELQKQHPKEWKDIDHEDKTELAKAKGGAIICESTSGFVDVDLFSSKKALDKQWKKVARSFESDEEGDEY